MSETFGSNAEATPYRLEEQVGFLLRRASQRHIAIFARLMPDLTPPQFAVLAKLREKGRLSQTELAQAVAMDAATVNGVVSRLAARGLLRPGTHETDQRKVVVAPTPEGAATVAALLPAARAITAETLAPLSPDDAAKLKEVLVKLG